MHGRSCLGGLIRAGLMTSAACLAMVGGAACAIAAAPPAFARDPTDTTAMDALFDEGGDGIDLTAVERGDWRPEHAFAATAPAVHAAPVSAAADPQPAPAATPAAAPAASRADKTLDPEPDGVITPPVAGPSHDPLDKPKPAPVGAPAAAAPLPPQEAAIKAALDRIAAAPLKGPGIGEKRKERAAIAFFYAAHGFAPAWSDAGKANAAVAPVLARLAHADEDALKLPATPKGLATTGTPDEIAASDIALTEAVVAYARQATGSRVDPRAISPLIGAKPDLADPAEVLDAVIAAGAQAGDTLRAQNPPEPRYVALRDQLAKLRGARDAGRAAILPGPTLKLGMRDPRVPALRARFDLDAGDGLDDPTVYDSALAVAIADFQREHGLPPSGALTKRTQAALSGGRSTGSEGTIVANMEMWRWMPRELGADRIEVNVPAYLVTVFHDNDAVATNRVVVGKTDTPTPLFSNTMKYLIVNPLWNVPQSIIQKELLPKGNGNLSYLQGRGYNVSYKHGQVTVQQESGAKNALGRIKFMFPNDFSVYLHDTPSKNFFQASRRAFSHGCVRVDKPFEFAESVLNDGVPEGGKILWSQARLQKMLGDKERYVYLPKPLPIHISYFTASVDADSGKLQTREDIYGYAHAVASALGEESDAPPPPRVVEKKPAPDRRPKRVADTYPRRAAEVPLPDEYTQAPRTTGSTGGGLFGWFGR